MTNRLGHGQTAAMLTLMALAREVSNTELDEIVGFRLTGKERVQLNDLGLVASRKDGSVLVHELTDRGWAWCREELTAATPPPPRPRSLLAVAMYPVLAALAEFMEREHFSVAEVFAPQAEDLTPDDIESRIRVAYRKLAPAPRDWVGLAELRSMLGGAPTDEVDAVLKQLSRSKQIRLVPDSNRKALTAADHAAAIRIGGEDNHLISIEVS
ncbi:MAG TPA: hypothetical protein VHF06_36815 [Pseudonocardiaceae bacterium]|jgi:hypothetical protein|nr:hypothetical protein [Pseudonocardiaceae bacterium]